MSRMLHTFAALSTLTAVTFTAGAYAMPTEAASYSRLERKAYRLGVAALDAVDATPAQRRAMFDIGRRAQVKLAPYHGDLIDIISDGRDAWTAQTVTREEVESVRVDTITLLDNASADSVDFVVEAANVLTPEQRRELAHAARRRAARLLD